ncbi:MAG: VRR-NUC domain-containing protein [Acidobacteriota bacterium]
MSAFREPEPGRRLRTGYYLDNFEVLLASVEARYGDLLAPGELEFLKDFRALPLGSRRLWVRLLTRKGPGFEVDRLRYCEIEISAAVEALRESGFAEEALGEGESRYLALRRVDSLRVFRLLFFGNLRQDGTEFILRDLGVLRFEAYPLLAESRTFSNREAVDRHLELSERRAVIESCLAAKSPEMLERAALIAEEVAGEEWQGSLRRRADRLVLAAARALERGGESDRSLALYSAVEAPPARERRVRILAGRGALDRAAALGREIALSPRDESERVFGEDFGRRLDARRAGVLCPRRRPAILPHRELKARRSAGSVEDAALEALAGEGYRGFFAENWLWRALFGLAFWDVVFAPVPGAFAHPFQYGPLDLHAGFRAARSELVDRRLEDLRGMGTISHLLRVWDGKRGIANHLVPWNGDLLPHLELATRAIRGSELAAISDRLSRDLPRYGHGLPDLFLVHPERGSWMLAEIKAPGDTLRPEQRGWLEYLAGHGIAAAVIHLRWHST